ncbi:MAG: rhomboid family intramembrane serine protease [Dehalococcoidia bacterium]
MIPIGDSPRLRSFPWVNYALIAVNLAVFVYMLTLSTDLPGSRAIAAIEARQAADSVCYGFLTSPTEVNHFFCEFGFQPREFFDVLSGQSLVADPDRRTVLLTILTSQFIHGGWFHIVGNMLFLWVFGDDVEDRFGHAVYLVFYLSAGAMAALVQGVIDPDNVVPVVGASGAVAGILGAYFLMFPRATVYVVIPFFFLIFVPLPVPAVLMIGLWFVQNLLAGFAELGTHASPSAGVAWFAHIGGFVFGMAVALLGWNAHQRPVRPPPFD